MRYTRRKPERYKFKTALRFSLIVSSLLFGASLVFWLRTGFSHQPSYQRISTTSQPSPAIQAQDAQPADDSPPEAPAVPNHDYSTPPTVNGTVPVIRHIVTTERVAFLTIDDGIVTNPADAHLMQAANAKATFFLVYRFIKNDTQFFATLAGATDSDIENHSYDHHLLPGLSYEVQKQDICQNADTFMQLFGKRPAIFRPSGGGYDDTTLKAAADCGMKALVLWDAAINNGQIRYQNGNHMQPGDIVLMHFRATFASDLNAFVEAARAANLQPDLLVNWIT